MQRDKIMHENEIAYTKTLVVDAAVRCKKDKRMHEIEVAYTKTLVVGAAVVRCQGTSPCLTQSTLHENVGRRRGLSMGHNKPNHGHGILYTTTLATPPPPLTTMAMGTTGARGGARYMLAYRAVTPVGRGFASASGELSYG